MRARFLTLALALYLAIALAACNKTPSVGSGSDSQNPSSSDQPKTDQPKAEQQTLVVPKGTTLTVKLGQAVGSKISEKGQSFTATLANSVKADGKELIPAGAEVAGTVVDAQPMGHFKGGARLQLRLNSVSINGNTQPIKTTSLVQTLSGKGKRSAVMIGGGGGVGALVGGLLGGGKGAAIGAVAGAGAGTAGAAYTGNKEIVLPAESAVSFKLVEAVQVQ